MAREDDDEDEDATVDTQQKQQRSRLHLSVQKELAEVIERAGGLHSFDDKEKHALSKLLDLGDSEAFGDRGSKQRRKISQKVYQWKHQPIQEYYQVLNKLGIAPASARPKSEIVRVGKSITPPKRRLSPKSLTKKKQAPQTRRAPSTSTDAVTELILTDFAELKISKQPKVTPEKTMPTTQRNNMSGTCAA
jgi:hypothetical protein